MFFEKYSNAINRFNASQTRCIDPVGLTAVQEIRFEFAKQIQPITVGAPNEKVIQQGSDNSHQQSPSSQYILGDCFCRGLQFLRGLKGLMKYKPSVPANRFFYNQGGGFRWKPYRLTLECNPPIYRWLWFNWGKKDN